MIPLEILRGLPCLAEVATPALEDLAAVARETTYRTGDRIVRLINPPQQLQFVLDGLVKMAAVSIIGLERIIYVFRPGEILGSRILLASSPEASYELVAMRDARVAVVSRDDFLAVAERHPVLLLVVMREFSRRLEGLTSRMLAAMSEDVPRRLGQLLLDFSGDDSGKPEAFIPLQYPLTHETMAQIIGASRPHTSTVLRDLEELGLVRRRSDRGLLVHPGGLARFVAGDRSDRLRVAGSAS